MNNIKLTFDSPWALFLLIPILALILVPWFLIPREKRRGFCKTAPAVLHVLIAVVLVFILAEAGLSGVEVPPDRAAELEAEEAVRETFLIIADSEEAAEDAVGEIMMRLGLARS